jgi:hypothetical protein
MDLNNDYNFVTTASVIGTTNAGTGTPVFVADAPANTGSTHSFKINGYSGIASSRPDRLTFKQFSTPINSSRTVTFWFKYKKAAGGSFAFGENIGAGVELFLNNPGTATNDEDIISITLGLNNPEHSGGDRKFSWTTRNVSTASNLVSFLVNPNQKLEQDTWYHVAFVQREVPSTTNIESAVYINGICINYTITPNTNGFAYSYGQGSAGLSNLGATIFNTQSGTGDNAIADKFIAHYAIFPTALTKEEIRAQAWYGLSGGNYVDLVNSDSPLYFTTLENEDKATDPTVYGATSWGPLNDSRSGVTVNQLGYPTGKSWRIAFTGTTTSQADTENPIFTGGMNDVIRTGEYSYEFWFKQDGKNTSSRQLFSYNGGTLGAGQQFFTLSAAAGSRLDFTSSYRTGAASYLSGSLSSTVALQTAGSTLGPGDNSTSLNGWADGEWHHAVYTQSNTQFGGAFFGQLFVDGFRVASRSWSNASGWLNLDNIDASSVFRLGDGSNVSIPFFIDNVAIYSRRLTEREIQEHFIAGKTYVAPSARIVKHWTGGAWVDSVDQKVWDGTNWVNWTSKYWNGTAWIDL